MVSPVGEVTEGVWCAGEVIGGVNFIIETR